jgi:ATP-binding cassette subfamily B protein
MSPPHGRVPPPKERSADDFWKSPIATIRVAARESFSLVPATLALVWKSSRAGTLLLFALTLLASAVPLAVAYVGKRIVDAVVAHDREAALRWVLFELGAVALQAAVMRGLGLVRGLVGARLGIDVNVRILEKAQTLELRHFEDPEFYDRLTRARREASSRPLSVVSESFQLLQNALTLVGYVALLFAYSWMAVVGLALAALPATVVEMRFSSQAFRLKNWRAPEARRLAYLEYVLANDAHAKEVMTFGLGPMLLGRYRELSDTIYDEDRRLALRRAWVGYALSLVAVGTFYGCYASLAVAAATGLITLGNLTLYLAAFRQGQQSFQSILSAIGGMYEDNLYMSNLFEFLAIETRKDRAPPAEAGARALPGGGEGLELDDVGFRYPGQETFALRHVSLRIPPGQRLALVGQNGSGKTTLIKLLTGLYRPTEGRVLLDGRDLSDWDDDALRARIGVIFQDYNKYPFTLGENVGVGAVDHMGDEPRVWRALESGGADDIAKAREAGLETPLGRWFKSEGVELSGGQWQRVALSRAFMREEADILVLDEPTSALDAEAEQAVFERFQALARGRTTILISHRFPTVRTADRIVVLAGGTIVEQGTHQELLDEDGRYARLFKLQAQGYL